MSIIESILNFLTRVGLAGVVFYSIWLPIGHYHYWFSWHVILCTIGYVPIMTESILLFTSCGSWLERFDIKTRHIIHGCLITIGTICFMIGNITIIYFTKKDHFRTVHGITGLISMIICLMSIFLGIATYYSQRLKNLMRPVKLKFFHNILGSSGYIVGIISLCFAFYTPWWIYYTGENSRIAAVIVTIITTLWTLNGSFTSGLNQIKAIYQ